MEIDQIQWEGVSIEYEWERKPRKTVGISISEEGKITVRVPRVFSRDEVRQCVRQKGQWILYHQQMMRRRQKNMEKRTYEEGEIFFYLGKEYVLKKNRVSSIRNKKSFQIELFREENETGTMLLSFCKGEWEQIDTKKVLEEWYKNAAREYINDKVLMYSKKISCTYHDIRIKNQKTCWGSCSTKGNLNFNWRIMMADPKIVDYVIVHELCHRLEMNHSAAFWKLVKEQIPDYMQRRNWLRENGWRLSW